MYKCILNVIAAGLLIVSMPVSAYYSGEDLHKDCSLYVKTLDDPPPSMPGEDGVRIGRCIGFTTGFFETHVLVIQFEHGDEIEKGVKTPEEVSLFKLPEKANIGARIEYFAKILSDYKENDPKRLKRPAAALMLKQMVIDFPVKKSR